MQRSEHANDPWSPSRRRGSGSERRLLVVSAICGRADVPCDDDPTRPRLHHSRTGKIHVISKTPHLDAAKRVLQYLKGTVEHGIEFSGEYHADATVTAFTDASWAAHEDRRSISGYVLYAGGGPISWSSKQQSTIALSTCEAEYTASTHAAKQILWTRNILSELDLLTPSPTPLFCDNSGTVACTQNPHNHSAMKHVGLKVHFIRDCVENCHIVVIHLPGAEMIADIFTKSLPAPAHEKWTRLLTLH